MPVCRGLVTLESGERRALSTRSRNETLRVGRLVFGRREGERLLHVSRPAMGIFDSFTKQWETVKEDTLEQKKQEGFKFQVMMLCCMLAGLRDG